MGSDGMGFLTAVLAADGTIEPDRLSERLHISKTQLARAVGLSKDAVTGRARLHAVNAQTRFRDLVEILDRVQGWGGSTEAALAWYRSAPLPSFGDMTAEDLVKQGRADAVKRYVSRIAVGGYA